MEGREQNTTKTRRSPYQEMRPEQASPDITALCSRLRTGGQSYRVCRDYRLFWLRYAHADNCRYFCCARTTRTATCSPIGACGGRDRASARLVEHALGARCEHEPNPDGLSRCAAIHRYLAGNGRLFLSRAHLVQ